MEGGSTLCGDVPGQPFADRLWMCMGSDQPYDGTGGDVYLDVGIYYTTILLYYYTSTRRPPGRGIGVLGDLLYYTILYYTSTPRGQESYDDAEGRGSRLDDLLYCYGCTWG